MTTSFCSYSNLRVGRSANFLTGTSIRSSTRLRWFSADGGRRLFAPDVGTLTSIEIDGTAITLGDVVTYPWNTPANLGLERIANGVFPCGIRNVKITGSWGYPNYLEPRGFTLTTPSSTALTAVVSSTTHKLSAGDTLRCGTEQIYVTGVTAARSLTVLRAMHGSIAETHTGAAISVYRYPEDLALAIGTQVRRWQTRAQTGFADEVGSTETGITRFSLGMSSEVRALLLPYRLQPSVVLSV